ncbi:hypothetical protein LU631_06885 [Erwinia tracheiphila]|uniref:hypothetical protein n=1 Tax=Erwinia tracheiphila TaxID=65700 RepID=UPI0003A5D04B|nr:hypothetical protein [Erwinia tracheiphila]UIA83802.1 hypothetical protein LU604_01375 [Erwinia tracheiphila]UIA88989.1 hypothetical protein LU631_06885 [Erwinia tracheiphila]UIA97372.1 hypothetical protein LU633_05565 [Erwinia tracheiphila]
MARHYFELSADRADAVRPHYPDTESNRPRHRYFYKKRQQADVGISPSLCGIFFIGYVL